MRDIFISNADHPYTCKRKRNGDLSLSPINPLFTTKFDLSKETEPLQDASTLQPLLCPILEHTLTDLITHQHFSRIPPLLSIDRYFLRRMYNKYFPHYTNSSVTDLIKIERLSRVFLIISSIYNDVLFMPNIGDELYYMMEFEFRYDSFTGTGFSPWNFVRNIYDEEKDIFGPAININLLTSGQPEVHGQNLDEWMYWRAFTTGKKISDIGWASGTQASCSDIFKCKSFLRPILVFLLSDRVGHVITTKALLNQNEDMLSFSNLLTLAFGPTTGIFFVLNDDDFSFGSEEYILQQL